MSDGQIKAGDLVMVVRPIPCNCSGSDKSIGKIFSVVDTWRNITVCHYCRKFYNSSPVWIAGDVVGEDTGYEFSRLIRIDPPAASATRTTEREKETT